MMSRSDETDSRPLSIHYESLEDFLDDYQLNLRRGRATVRSERALVAGQRVELAIAFPGLRHSLSLSGRVAAVVLGSDADARYQLDLAETPAAQREAFAAVAARVAKRDPALFSPRRLRVLVVEDNRHVAELIQRGLEGHLLRTRHSLTVDVDVAEDGAEALRLVASAPYGLLLVDICLPLLSGTEVIAALRKDGLHHELPVIALSAADDVAEEALRAGANAFLSKPIQLKELLATIAELVPAIKP